MTYKELAPSDKAPFPFPKDEHGAYPIGAYPPGVLSFDQGMQAYYAAVLAAAQKIDAGATISDDIGMVVVSLPDGKNLMLTGGLWTEYNLGLATVEAQLSRAGIAPPPVVKPPHVDPGPVLDVPFLDVDGKWYKYSGPFMFKVSCPAPVGAPPTDAMDTAKAKVIGIIRTRLSAQPPKPQVVVDELISLAIEVNAIPD